MLWNKNEIKNVCLNEIKSIWMDAVDSFPDFLEEIPIESKTKNKRYIKTVTKQFKKLKKRKKWKKKMCKMIEDVLFKETIIGIHNTMSTHRIGVFQNELKDFFTTAREFAPSLSIEEIGQALRNYIVYTMFVEMNQMKPGFNKACFGYSMLYPFTDNYIDSNAYSNVEKKEYNKNIRKKIAGEIVEATSLHQEKTCELLLMIESQYPRDIDPSIFMLLQMMLEAQEESLKQQSKDCLLSYEERLDISICKGGISVLIDRFFVNKRINKEDLKFYLGFGFFLQLVDDLQDIAEDSNLGHQTIFTTDLDSNSIEKIVNKMFRFLYQIMKEYQIENNVFKEFFLQNCYEFICLAIVGSKGFFSQKYLDRIEQYMLVSSEVIENIKNKKIGNREKEKQENQMELLDEIMPNTK